MALVKQDHLRIYERETWTTKITIKFPGSRPYKAFINLSRRETFKTVCSWTVITKDPGLKYAAAKNNGHTSWYTSGDDDLFEGVYPISNEHMCLGHLTNKLTLKR